MLTGLAIVAPRAHAQPPPPPPNGTAVVVPIPLVQGTTTGTLPAGASVNRVARVRLRFVDMPLGNRGDSWRYTVSFRLTPLNNGVLGTPQISSLTIFRGLDRESFEAVAVLSPLNGNAVQVDVLQTDSMGQIPPTGITCELELTAATGAAFSATQVPSIALQPGTPAVATLGSLPPASVSYEFEWVFYDQQEPLPTDPFGSRESVRVATPKPQAAIDMTYPAGTLYVRGRAMGRFAASGPDSAVQRSGRWSNVLTVPISSNTMATSVNWNYVAGFAESSDAVSNVGFFDGAFRNRQSQTRVAAQGSRLIGETKFDREGRSVLTFLPAPVDGLRFQYVPLFNAVDPPPGTTGLLPYDANQFDGVMPAKASAVTGAGRYYSPSAVAGAPQDAYVPAADGYPFSLTEPTRDDRGRPRRKSGAGDALRMGGGHDVLFRYGTASSSPLHQLFGPNVGRAVYYERNFVIDANRQAHVAYVDRAGRVVATALTGGAPQLESVAPATLPWMTYRLDENNTVDAQAGVSRSVNRVAVQETADLFFTYDLNGVDYSVPGSTQFPTICESCRYHLRIRVLDPGGKPVVLRDTATPQSDPTCSNSPQRQEIASVVGATAPQPNSCAAPGAVSVPVSPPASTGPLPVHFCAKLTEPGEYEVIKELTLVDGAVDSVVTNTLSAPGIFDVTTYRPDGEVVEQQCHQDCDQFCASVTTANDLKAQCQATCREGLTSELFKLVANQECRALEEEIRADVAPGGILAGTNLTDHPEFCRIKRLSPATPSICERSVATDTFDYRMMSVGTYADALCRGYLDPLQGTAGAPARPTNCNVLAEHDPFIDAVQIGRSLKGQLESLLQDYTGGMPGFSAVQPAIHESIWQVVARPLQPGNRPPTDDERWQMFRSLYMGAKQTVLVQYLENPASDDYCPYWNDKHAHVKRPYTFTTIATAQTATVDSKTSYCADQCSGRAVQWIADLESACGTPIPAFYKSQRLAPNLRQYCVATCEGGAPDSLNALPIITTAAVANDPSLVQATQPVTRPPYQLPRGCTLDLIAEPGKQSIGGPVASGSSAVKKLGPNSDPQAIAAAAVDPHYVFPPLGTSDMCIVGANQWADQLARLSLDRAEGDFRTYVEEQHYKNCFGSQLKESFSYQARQGEFHFTLHYFDQAGDLVQTVPPEGVHPLSAVEIDQLENGTPVAGPAHTLTSTYRYNSLGQALEQQTPDSGVKRFWYNAQGQLRLSQNAQQQVDGRYAFVRYDRRGRVVETGLVANPPDTNDAITPLDPMLLKGYTDNPDFPNGFTREQTVATSYDRSPAECQGLNPRNLRGRIAAIVAATTIGATTIGATTICYSYDPHGNIESFSQSIAGLGTKTTQYECDILDGKVLATHYQAGENDAIHHRYTYDLDRRLTAVETSRDGELWERDAAYTYYQHGPLARIELGADRVQGVDYTYAITNWPKGVNADTLTPERDPGRDGASGGPNVAVARDVFGSAVHYFPNDYRPVATALTSATQPYAATIGNGGALSALAGAGCDSASTGTCGLFDGNVSATISALANAQVPGAVLGTSYRYDQLYRLRSSTTFGDVDTAGNRWPQSSTDPQAWRTSTSYDGNGNIDRLQRYAASPLGGTSALMDDLTYHYARDASNNLISNRLSDVHDEVPDDAFPNDLNNQQTNNYVYDASGRLTRDGAAGLNAIRWNAAGQVATIDRLDDTIEFIYDGLGNRVVKIVRAGTDPTTWNYEYYVRDHNGTIIATYKSQPPATPGAQAGVALADQTIVGAKRLGTWVAVNAPSLQIIGPVAQPAGIVPPPGGIVRPPAGGLVALIPIKRYTRVRGDKQYELTNYLGNVEATITDRKIPVLGNGVVTHYEAQQVNTSGYYPFGALMPGFGSQSEAYRFGFSGLERDDELKGPGNSYYTSARLFDPRIGRWLSPDPLDVGVTSSFVGFANNPLRYSDARGTDEHDEIKPLLKEFRSSDRATTPRDVDWNAAIERGTRRHEQYVAQLKQAQEAYDQDYAGWFAEEKRRGPQWLGGTEGGPGGESLPNGDADVHRRVVARIGERPEHVAWTTAKQAAAITASMASPGAVLGALRPAATTTEMINAGIIVHEFQTSKGVVEMAAEVQITGRVLHLKDIAVFPRGAESFNLGAREVATLRNQLAQQAKTLGFEELRITGTRSTGANPGKLVDVTVDLTKLKP
jgi:RHS repeat-associated protein